jgi:glycosyltransferase involved in cell wall biosynthesis
MFSVIIPVYNHDRYLEEAILSCLNDVAVTEILLADDGSQDASLRIINDFSRRLPGKIRNLSDDPPRNIGAHNRLNQLVEAASNEWVAVLNSDDAFGAGRFENVRQWLRARQTDFVFGNLAIVDPDSGQIGWKSPLVGAEYPYPVDLDMAATIKLQNWFAPLLNQNLIATTSNMIFRKALHLRIGGFRNYRYAHDWDFALRACMLGDVSYCANMITRYRIHPGNTIKENKLAIVAEIRGLFDRFLADFPSSRECVPEAERTRREHARLGNNYLKDRDCDLVAVVAPRGKHKQVKNAMRTVVPWVQVYESFDVIPSSVAHVYAPRSERNVLGRHAMLNLILSLAIAPHDFIIAQPSLVDFPNTAIDYLLDCMIARPSIARAAIEQGRYSGDGRGRIARFPQEEKTSTQPLSNFLVGPIEERAGELFVGSARASMMETLQHVTFASPKVLGVVPSGKPVIFLLPGLIAIGGVERIMIDLVSIMKTQYDFVVVCTERLASAQGSWEERLLEHCVAIYNISETLPRHLYFLAFSFLKQAYNPKLIWICNGSTWQCEHAFVLRKLFRDIPIVDHQAYDANVGWITWFDHVGVRSADCFFATTRRIYDSFRNKYDIPAEKIVAVDHPISADLIKDAILSLNPTAERAKFDVHDGSPVIAFVGRLSPQKEPLRFLELCRYAQEAGIEVQFLLIGGGVLANSCDAFIAANELTNVRRLGFVNNILEIYSFVDGLVITSAYEGLPIALLQAIGMGIPSFSTDVGDIRSVVEPYHAGVVIDPGWSEEQTRAAFSDWLRNIESWKAGMSDAAQAVCDRFSIETVTKTYSETFDRLIFSAIK